MMREGSDEAPEPQFVYLENYRGDDALNIVCNPFCIYHVGYSWANPPIMHALVADSHIVSV